jgi:Ca2+-binding RTX toxin-like protein
VIADGSELRTIPASSGLHTFPTQISVKAGDYIGIRSTSGECGIETGNAADTWDFRFGTATPVGATGNFAELSGGIWDISAQLEPDADGDGFGDETQDQCPTDPSTQGPCPAPGPITTPTGPAPTLPGGAPATCRGLPATIVGTEGNDVRVGTPGRDVMLGLGGNDRLVGLAGNDVICGAKGRDTLKGGPGNDFLSGQKGNDKLFGGKGRDKLSGKKGKDLLVGGKGNDKLKGGGGRDLCIGGKANDTASKCEVEKSI